MTAGSPQGFIRAFGHHPPKDVGDVGLAGTGIEPQTSELVGCAQYYLCGWLNPSVLTNLKETSLFFNYLLELSTGEKPPNNTEQ